MLIKKLRILWSRYKSTAIPIIFLVAILGGVIVYKYATRDDGPLPMRIRQELTFSPFVLPNGKDYVATDYKFTTAEDKVQVLSFVITNKDYTVTVSEYPQPTEFAEIPEYKDRFLSNVAKQYATVPTTNGTVYLGRSARQNNMQLTVLVERGLIVFMSPSKELDPSEWRRLADRLEVQKVLN